MIDRDRMTRRRFLAASAVAGGAAGSARAQQPGKVYRVAILARGEPVSDLAETSPLRYWRVWHEEMRRRGYAEGQNLILERRSAEGDVRRLPALVREIASLKPDVIFASAHDSVGAFKAAATAIPIVGITGDPVRSGFVTSLARPGGNITGFSVDAGTDLVAKRIALLKEVVPSMSRLAVLIPRQHWEAWMGDKNREAARRLGIAIIGATLEAPVNDQAYRRAFAGMIRDRADSIQVEIVAENVVHRRLIAELAADARLPAIYGWRDNVEAGGLMAYAFDPPDIFRRAAGYIDRILRGAKPAELPFEQPTKFELVINLKTAKALGLAVPESLLLQATEVIE